MALDNLRDIVSAMNPQVTNFGILGTVIAVDKDENTCEVEPFDEDTNYVGVSLMTISAKGLVVYPLVGSTVIIQQLDKDNAYVAQYGEIEAYAMETQDDSLLEILLEFVNQMGNLKVTTPNGPSTTVINKTLIDDIGIRLRAFFQK